MRAVRSAQTADIMTMQGVGSGCYTTRPGTHDDERATPFVHAGHGRGVASTLVDYAERKGAAWGAAGLCLHVNRLNTPALRLYDRLGFSVVPDWYGYNNQRFLLFKPLNGEAPETPPPAAPPRNALSPLQKEILVEGETEPPGASAKPGGLDYDLKQKYGTRKVCYRRMALGVLGAAVAWSTVRASPRPWATRRCTSRRVHVELRVHVGP